MFNFDSIECSKGFYVENSANGQILEVVTFNGRINKMDTTAFDMRINYPTLYRQHIDDITIAYKAFILDLFECSYRVGMTTHANILDIPDIFSKNPDVKEDAIDKVVDIMSEKLKESLESFKINLYKKEDNQVDEELNGVYKNVTGISSDTFDRLR